MEKKEVQPGTKGTVAGTLNMTHSRSAQAGGGTIKTGKETYSLATEDSG